MAELRSPSVAGGGDPAPSRVALVTGGSRGIGRHIALALGRAGVDVAVLARDADAVAAVAAEIAEVTAAEVGAGAAGGPRVHAVSADVTDLDAVSAAVEDVERELGGVDLLVNNAGAIDSGEVPLWEADAADWRHVLEVGVLGPFHCARVVVPGMLARGGGRVVDLNSGSGTRDMEMYSAYNVAKTALFRIGGGLHAAGHDRGLRTFEVAPGVVRTEMTGAMGVHADRTEWTDPDAVAELVLAVARGELDAFSGRFLRAGSDDVATLRAVAERGLPARARTLGVLPWGDDDPLA